MKMVKWFFAILIAVGFSLPVPASAQSQYWGSFFSPYSSYYGDYSYYYGGRTGIKFDFDLVSKTDFSAVKRGTVLVDDNNSGIVNRFDSWYNGVLPVFPGNHRIIVKLEDGREFSADVFVLAGTVLHLNVGGFSKPPELPLQSREKNSPPAFRQEPPATQGEHPPSPKSGPPPEKENVVSQNFWSGFFGQ